MAQAILLMHRPEEDGQQPGRARRKTQQALAYEVLVHFTIQIRAFYTAVAKAIQTPVRRREELGTAPTMAMRAAAINMAVVLRENMRFKILPVSHMFLYPLPRDPWSSLRLFLPQLQGGKMLPMKQEFAGPGVALLMACRRMLGLAALLHEHPCRAFIWHECIHCNAVLHPTFADAHRVKPALV